MRENACLADICIVGILARMIIKSRRASTNITTTTTTATSKRGSLCYFLTRQESQ
jgi:hypothetical protein